MSSFMNNFLLAKVTYFSNNHFLKLYLIYAANIGFFPRSDESQVGFKYVTFCDFIFIRNTIAASDNWIKVLSLQINSTYCR